MAKRRTNADRAEELASLGMLKPLFLDVDGLALCTGVAVQTIRNAIAKLPQKWTWESIEAEMAKGKFVPPPVTKMGEKITFSMRNVYRWEKLLPQMGRLPDEEEERA